MNDKELTNFLQSCLAKEIVAVRKLISVIPLNVVKNLFWLIENSSPNYEVLYNKYQEILKNIACDINLKIYVCIVKDIILKDIKKIQFEFFNIVICFTFI